MKPSRFPNPRSVVFVAVLALCLGTFGTFGVSHAASVTKKQVRKIAAKVVKTKAPKLTVKNAQNLDGQPAAVYLDRVIYDFNGETINLTADVPTQTLPPQSLSVPEGVELVHAIGTSTMFGNAVGTIWIAMDTTCVIDGPGFGHRATVDPGTDETPVTFNWVTPVTPGVHTFRLCARNSVASVVRGRTMAVETVADGSADG